jgi:hypothetical protein
MKHNPLFILAAGAGLICAGFLLWQALHDKPMTVMGGDWGLG